MQRQPRPLVPAYAELNFQKILNELNNTIKEVGNDVNLDWINNQACHLSQNICVITNLFITNDNLFEMLRRIILSIIFLDLYTKLP